MDHTFIPLSIPHLQGNELKYLTNCIETGWVSSAGPFVDKFEDCVRENSGSKYAVALSSGTAALHISLILSGVVADDEVIVPTVTFIAPVNAVKYVGAHPVFMDCDDYLNLDVQKLREFCENECLWKNGKLVNKKSGRTIKAIIPVHVFGHPVDIEILMEVAMKYNLIVIEDATESLGSYYKEGKYNGKKTGTIGKLGCYSFNGNKILTTGGGGIIVTDEASYAEKARYLTTQAKDDEQLFIHNEIGYNYRLTNIQAALGVAQMEKLEDFIKIKRGNFKKYFEAFNKCNGLSFISEPPYSFSNYWHYGLLVDSDELKINNLRLMKELRGQGIQTRPLWQLNHMQKPYQNCQTYKIEKAPHYHDRILNIPCSVGITDGEIASVVDKIKRLVATYE